MKTEGIIIKSIPYKETSKIVYVYTPFGMKSIKALGGSNSKKNTFGFAETGNIVSFIASDNDFPSLIEYEILESAYKYTDSFNSIKALSKVIELIGYLPEDSYHEKIFSFIKKTLADISINPLKALSIFLIKMTFNFGVAPKLDSCVFCQNSLITGFSVSKGGVLCIDHNEFNTDDLKIWTEYYKDKKEIDLYTDCDFNKLLNRINEYYLIHAHINLKL